jgi:hypothetical protein
MQHGRRGGRAGGCWVFWKRAIHYGMHVPFPTHTHTHTHAPCFVVTAHIYCTPPRARLLLSLSASLTCTHLHIHHAHTHSLCVCVSHTRTQAGGYGVRRLCWVLRCQSVGSGAINDGEEDQVETPPFRGHTATVTANTGRLNNSHCSHSTCCTCYTVGEVGKCLSRSSGVRHGGRWCYLDGIIVQVVLGWFVDSSGLFGGGKKSACQYMLHCC